MTEKFLLVDDDADDSELFCEALKEVDNSIFCDCVGDGKEALEKLNGESDDLPSVIIMDINMPEMNGWECLVQLKRNQNYKDIPVVMYSTSRHERENQIARELGAIWFFTKPSDYLVLKKIVGMVVRCLQKGSFEEIDILLKQ